ncbi:NACHT domain-containing protein [Nocardiopsis alba]|uniref:NACHT domain-containing protein n=1 Tax=Nocardiopsis alba TaxID=53437 RepID=UPI00034D8A50|nr:ATP-binding protein [Nocardiopsis alba]
MAKPLRYEDALRILGENDSEVLDLAEKVADGGLGLVGVPDLFGLRGALVGKGRKALEGMRGKLKGESRLSRTEKIEAAYQVLVIISFFEAAAEAFEEVGMPFGLDDLKITAEEQYTLLDQRLISAYGSVPLFADTCPNRRTSIPWPFLQTGFPEAFVAFVCGLEVAERHGITAEHALMDDLRRSLKRLVSPRFEENLLRLGAEIPEFGMWLSRDEHARTRREIGTGLSDLHAQLARVGSGRAVPRRRRELSVSYRAVLDRPVLRSAEIPHGLRLPSLREAYIPPQGRLATATGKSSFTHDDQWRHRPVQGDLQSLVAALITHPRSTEVPLVILGHPGAGKSKFTEMLAAQLPSEDFLPIRVELRSVGPNAPLHIQIEEGLRADLHTSVSWRELADDTEGALPVIILDGFDELLQASGVDRSDYLERVQEFQQRQEALGRPVVVIVTSRTLVADRTRFPLGTQVIRLEPFDEVQIERMLDLWNRTNEAAFTERGLLPLEADTVLRYRDLAEQPLLLLMLLIYDAHDNALRRASEHLSHGELYERLLRMFASREVTKHHSRLGGRAREQAVEDELRRLEVVSMAMFARGRQSVHAEELDRDLAVLMPEAVERPDHTDLHGEIAPAHRVLGRFFFVHEDRARTADGTSSAFEFLHATFGEYLVARMVITALEELAEDRRHASRRRGRSAPLDDGELYALSSFAAFAGRDKVVSFLEERLELRVSEDPELGHDLRELLLDLFREAPFPAPNRSFLDYEPQRLSLSTREACYTANLLTLAILLAEEPIPFRELYPESTDPWHAWRRTVSLWRSLPTSQWFGILDTARVRHLGFWENENPVTVLDRERGGPVNLGECTGFELRGDVDAAPGIENPYEVEIPTGTVAARLLRSTALRANGTASRLALILSPYLRHVSDDLGTWYVDRDEDGERSWILAHDILRLRLEPLDTLTVQQVDERLSCYRRLLREKVREQVVLDPSVEKRRVADNATLTVLRQAYEDLRSWPSHADMRYRSELASLTQRTVRTLSRTSFPSPEIAESFARLRHEILAFLGEDSDDPELSPPDSDPSVPFRYPSLPESPFGSAGP